MAFFKEKFGVSKNGDVYHVKAEVKKSAGQQRTPLHQTEFFKNWKKTAKPGSTFPRKEFETSQRSNARSKAIEAAKYGRGKNEPDWSTK